MGWRTDQRTRRGDRWSGSRTAVTLCLVVSDSKSQAFGSDWCVSTEESCLGLFPFNNNNNIFWETTINLSILFPLLFPRFALLDRGRLISGIKQWRNFTRTILFNDRWWIEWIADEKKSLFKKRRKNWSGEIAFVTGRLTKKLETWRFETSQKCYLWAARYSLCDSIWSFFSLTVWTVKYFHSDQCPH